MTPGNFNWFLHTMLFYHTKYVIQKRVEINEDEEPEDDESGEET